MQGPSQEKDPSASWRTILFGRSLSKGDRVTA